MITIHRYVYPNATDVSYQKCMDKFHVSVCPLKYTLNTNYRAKLDPIAHTIIQILMLYNSRLSVFINF